MLNPATANIEYWQERTDLAATFRWTERLNMHEAVANHFSYAVDDSGTRFLINPNQKHFPRSARRTFCCWMPMTPTYWIALTRRTSPHGDCMDRCIAIAPTRAV